MAIHGTNEERPRLADNDIDIHVYQHGLLLCLHHH
jgi:hypothetical protein